MTAFVSRFAFPTILLILAILAITGKLFSASPFVIVGQLLGIVLNAAGRAQFPKTDFRFTAQPAGEGLLRTGPYRLVRHPMYAGMLLFVLASVLGHLSVWTAIAGLGIAGIVLWRVEIEERLLRERYPEFAAAATSTKRLIPFVY